MSSSTRLEAYRNTVQEQVLPMYESLGQLTLVYLLGSLAAGYTQDADLDLMMVWDDPEVPTASLREPLVARLDERQGVSPFVVDYRDIQIERYVIDGQEYNVAHQALASFESLLQSILDGRRDNTERVLDPLVATAGFAYGELVWDRESRGHQWKSRLNTFPPMVKQECRRAVLAHRQAYLTDLRTLMGPADWFKFHCTLVEALRTTVRALFALHEVYYPGDKWLRQSIIRFGLGEEVLTCFGRLFEAQGSAPERASEQHAALLRLMDLVEEDEAGKLQPCQSEHVCAKREAVVTDFPIGQPPYMLGGRFVTVTLVYHSFPDRSARSRLLPVLSTAQPTAAKARAPAAVPGPLSSGKRGFPRYGRSATICFKSPFFGGKLLQCSPQFLCPKTHPVDFFGKDLDSTCPASLFMVA